MKKALLHYLNETNRVRRLIDILNKEYEVVECTSFECAKKNLEEYFNDLAVLLIDLPYKKEYTNELIELVEEHNNYMFKIPVLIFTDNEHLHEDDKYLSDTVVGLISENDSESIILSRVRNAIKFTNSTSFDEFSEMLTALPSLIYLKDKDGRYAFCSQHWHHLNTDESIRGKTDFDIRKDKNNAQIARNSDLKVINSGKGTSYTIKEEDEEGIDYLQIIKEPLKNDKGEVTGIIAIINNITNEEILRQELRRKSITDQLTGVNNREYFHEVVEGIDKIPLPFSVISIDCDGLKKINDKHGHAAGDKYIIWAKEAVKENLPKDSYLFRMGGDEFVALVPNTNHNKAMVLVKNILLSSKKYKSDHIKLSISVGAHTVIKKPIDMDRALAMSDKAMYKMKNKKKRKTKK